MPVTIDKPAPYAPASAILELIKRHRSKGLPSPVTADVLARAGISNSLIPRTLQALQTLDLIDEEGAPSAILEDIRKVPESSYQQRLAEWLKDAYADALKFVDLATADETQVRDAFRSYKPIGMQSRMVTLFIGLFAAAGIALERQKPPTSRKPLSASLNERQGRNAPRMPKATSKPQNGYTTPPLSNSNLPPALAGLLVSLPPEGEGWTRLNRDKFVQTFSVLLDFCFPVIEGSRQKTEQENDMEDQDK